MPRLVALALAWLALTAATPLPLMPPPPDVAAVIPFVSAPLDKPAIAAPTPPLPPPPSDIPPLRPAAVAIPAVDKPIAPLGAPGAVPCIWAWLPSASEQLKCGMARFYRGELEKAREVLEQSVRGASEREVIAEARYWLAETHYALGRSDLADPVFRQVANDPQQPLAVWAQLGSGWTALRGGDVSRARDIFARLSGAPVPPPLDGWSRHGLGLALYGLGRFEDAERVWGDLLARTPPSPIARDVSFWHGETLGRIGRYPNAEAELKRFTDGGAHALLETGLLRQGWWTLAAGHPKEAVTPFRAVLAMPVRSTAGNSALERDWADAGLALALLGARDIEGARRAVEPLRTRRSPLLMPVMLRLAAGAVEAKRGADAVPIIQDLLSGQLDQGSRAWVLLVYGDASYAEGNRDDARTQYELARQIEASGLLGWHALLRLARTNFELREFAQAATDLAPLLSVPLPVELRNIALLLRGEAAYRAGDYTAAADAFRRALVEVPANEAAGVRLALGWTAYRQGRSDDARRIFLDFVKTQPEHALAGDALMLASELALTDGDIDEARGLVDRVLAGYAAHPRIEFAKLNRALLMLRAGDANGAQPILREWIRRAPEPALVGRAQAALGAVLLATGKPADAGKAFAEAAKAGETGLGTLGAGAVALSAGRLDEATKTLRDARDAGPVAVTAAAEYGLAVVAHQKGDTQSFVPIARAELAHASPASAPRLLYVLTGAAVEQKNWQEALDNAKRLVAEFPSHEVTDDVLERVGGGAASARVWPVAQESYELLRQRYPKSPFADAAMVAVAEAQINTGRAAEAATTLERFVADNPKHPDVGRAWLALGRAREAAGQMPGAQDAYAAAMRDSRVAEVRRDAAVGQARVLLAGKKFGEARTLLQSIVLERDPAIAAEAAQAIGETYRGEGEALAAAEYFMTAAYVAPNTPVAGTSLLFAAQSLAAAKQLDAAAIVYRKLLAQANLPADLADVAKRELAALPAR
jgi:tetratricopeptide (TPR) repeat protein